MATSTNNITTALCAACGKGGCGLKLCNGCKLVKYCGVDCQRSHRPQHKMECTKRAAELHDEALFKQPPSRGECPICFLELPCGGKSKAYKACCGKIICSGCDHASAEQNEDYPCPFCRMKMPRSDEESVKKIERRMELNDPNAIEFMGDRYLRGEGVIQQDIDKALELFHRAAECGSIGAHDFLGRMYFHGQGVEVDEKKAKYHWEIAAMAGHMAARHDIGALEWNNGYCYRGTKHWMVSASAGDDDSLKMVQTGYRNGFVTKDDFETTLRAHKKSQDEMKSEWREKAAADRRYFV